PPSSTLFPYTTLFRSTGPGASCLQCLIYRGYILSSHCMDDQTVNRCPQLAQVGRYLSQYQIYLRSLVACRSNYLVQPTHRRFGKDRKSTRLNSSHLVI